MGRLAERLRRSPPRVDLAAPVPFDGGTPGFEHRVRRWPLSSDGSDAATSPVLGVRLTPGDLPDGEAVVDALDHLGRAQAAPAIFLDTETTGLDAGPGSGTGPTVPFLVGFAVYEPSHLRVEQFTLNSLASERSMLRAVLESLASFTAQHGRVRLVSYNGASFDLPLLRRRAERLGLAGPARVLEALTRGHLDLLHPSRRLWRDRFEDCRLTTLERRVLGAVRRHDIPGHEIPAVFWDALRHPESPAVATRLALVRAHNELDLISLPRLAVAAGRIVAAPALHELDERLRVADHLDKLGIEGRAAVLLGEALAAGVERGDPRRIDASLRCSRWLRRGGDVDAAVRVLEAACEEFPGDPSLHDSLAKELEHRRRDPVAALAVLERSQAPCPRRRARLLAKAAPTGRPGDHAGA